MREEILQDVSGAGRHIELFKDIDDLLKQNSLSSRPLDTSGGVDLFDIAQVAPTIIEMVGNALNAVNLEDSTVEFRSGSLIASDFQSGTRYQVSTSSQFIEATFRVTVSTQISFKPKPISWASMGALAGSPGSLSGLSGIRRPSESFDAMAFVDLSTRVVDQQVGLPEVERIRFSKKD